VSPGFVQSSKPGITCGRAEHSLAYRIDEKEPNNEQSDRHRLQKPQATEDIQRGNLLAAYEQLFEASFVIEETHRGRPHLNHVDGSIYNSSWVNCSNTNHFRAAFSTSH
jgi:hypothetical protein